jgi:hypothetical protein
MIDKLYEPSTNAVLNDDGCACTSNPLVHFIPGSPFSIERPKSSSFHPYVI